MTAPGAPLEDDDQAKVKDAVAGAPAQGEGDEDDDQAKVNGGGEALRPYAVDDPSTWPPGELAAFLADRDRREARSVPAADGNGNGNGRDDAGGFARGRSSSPAAVDDAETETPGQAAQRAEQDAAYLAAAYAAADGNGNGNGGDGAAGRATSPPAVDVVEPETPGQAAQLERERKALVRQTKREVVEAFRASYTATYGRPPLSASIGKIRGHTATLLNQNQGPAELVAAAARMGRGPYDSLIGEMNKTRTGAASGTPRRETAWSLLQPKRPYLEEDFPDHL